MPLRCGICPLVTDKWADSTSGEQCVCPMKIRGYNILPATYECDVPIEDMRMDLKWALDYADMLQRAIAMREAEANAVR